EIFPLSLHDALPIFFHPDIRKSRAAPPRVLVRSGRVRAQHKTQPSENFMSLMREMLEAGVHFGHQTRYWNPKIAPYIFGHRNKIHIINLEQTDAKYQEAAKCVKQLAGRGGNIRCVGNKRAARALVAAEAARCAMPDVDARWLGGMLTNFKTVK